MTRSVALVTGGSQGIGAALAQCAAYAGHDLLLVARSAATLEECATRIRAATGRVVSTLPVDLVDPDAVDVIAQTVAENDLAVDVLINNAGIGTFGPFVRTDPAQSRSLLDLNIRAVVALSHRFLPAMIERKRGGILNVASVAAFQPGPLMATYYASKAFVLSFTEALAVELDGTGVKASALCPGPVVTGFQARAGLDKSGILRFGIENVDDVARAGWRGFERGQPVVLSGARFRMMAFGNRFLPRSVVARVVGRVQKERAAAGAGGHP